MYSDNYGVSVRIDKSLHERLKKITLVNGTKLKDTVDTIVEEFINEYTISH